jgi:hypothetical protein
LADTQKEALSWLVKHEKPQQRNPQKPE